MKKIIILVMLSILSGVSYATDDKGQVEKIFRVNMDINRTCPSKKQDKEVYEIVTRNISNLSGTKDPALVKLKSAEPLLRKSIIFEVEESGNLRSDEVESYIIRAKKQVERCKELRFLLSNF